jgi:LPXTG-site transpeptidase (sortase) family protein
MKAWRIARIPIALALVAAGAAVMLYPQFTEWRYAWQQSQMAGQAAAAAKGVKAGAQGGMPMPEGAVAKVVIPAIGLDGFVLEGVESAQLDLAVGHYPETPLPGEKGNAGLAGHRTMYGHPFRRLDELKPGDRIETWTTAKHAVYTVVKTERVDPGNVGVIAPADGYRITLTTCNPVGSARERLVVTGELAAN